MMFLLDSSVYLPERIVDNDYFASLTGKPAQWFEQRTGIKQRRRAAADENLNTMGVAAVQSLLGRRHDALDGVDLIIAGSYTPVDTIGTLAHVIQRRFELHDARAIYLSTACSSFLDAVDVASAYFGSGRARKALIVAAEHNSAHSRDEDAMSGHLWGDGAAAVVLSAANSQAQFEVLDVSTRGLGHLGQGPQAITLNTAQGLLEMPHGREVFARACQEMASSVRTLLAAHGLGVDALRLLVPHQANKRILDHVAQDLALPAERLALTIDTLGNTGCASVAITLHRYADRVAPGEYAVLATFGGGYSVGAALLRRIGSG